MALKTFAVFPTWVLLLIAKPLLPKAHPWRHRTFPLREWAERGTPLLVHLGAFAWLQVILVPAMLYILFKGHP